MKAHFMKTNALPTRLLLLCLSLSVQTRVFAITNVIYTGSDLGNWNDSSNWSPMMVPNNGGGRTFAVTIPNPVDVTLDTDVAVSNFSVTANTFAADGNILSIDHNFTAAFSSFTNNGNFDVVAETQDVTFNLGHLADFSGTSLNSGWFYVLQAEQGRRAIMQFNSANIHTNYAGIGFFLPGTERIVDERGNDALANWRLNAIDLSNNVVGYFEIGAGANQTLAKAFTNAGQMVVDGSFGYSTTLTFARDFTLVGDIRDNPKNKDGGILFLYSNSAAEFARIVINGELTNYDAETRTLHRGRYNLQPSGKGVATIQVLGGKQPFDIVDNNASILLTAPGAAILDRNGMDALRNLNQSFRLRLVDHSLTVHHDLTTHHELQSLLAVRGNAHLMVAHDLKVRGGYLEMSPLEGFDLGDPLVNSDLRVGNDLHLDRAAVLRFEVFNGATGSTINVQHDANLEGALEIYLPPGAPIMNGGGQVLLNAGHEIEGTFRNRTKTGRVPAYIITDFNNEAGQFNGTPAGSFKVTITKQQVIISDHAP